MGLSEDQFFDCTPVYFMRRRRAWLQNRNGMEEARFIAFHVMKAGGYKVRRLTDIVKFPWDVVVRRVHLEAWDSPAMKQFDEEADRALAVLNPAAYEKYMAGKKARAESGGDPVIDRQEALQTTSGSLNQDDRLTISDELTI